MKHRVEFLEGEIGKIEFDWRYVYVDQQNRIDLIREVYGIEAEPMGIDTRQYERWLHSAGFSAMKYMRQAEKVLRTVRERKEGGEAFSEAQIALYGDCYRAYTALKNGFDEATAALTPLYAAAPWREKKGDSKGWTQEQKDRDRELTAREKEIETALKDLKCHRREGPHLDRAGQVVQRSGHQRGHRAFRLSFGRFFLTTSSIA